VFVNGLGGLRESWMNQVRAFSPTRCVVTYNQRGIGGSEVLDEDATMADFAADLVALLDDLGLSKVDLVGISFGGRVLQEVALQAPERVRHLVLVATSCGGPHHMQGEPRAVAALRSAATLSEEAWMRDVIPGLFGEAYLAPRERELRWLARYWSQHPPSAVGLARHWQAYDAFDRWADLPRLRVDTTILHGTADRLTPPVNAEILAARIPGARLIWIPDAGHSPNVEAPERFNAALRSTLDG